MQKRLRNSLFQLVLRHPFTHSQESRYPLSLGLQTPIPTQLVPNSVEAPIPNFVHTPTSHVHTFSQPFHQIPQTRSPNGQTRRRHSGESGGQSAPELDVNKEVDMINLKFAEAREEIEMAMESKETLYFDEEAECARAAVKEVVDMFDGLLRKLPESEKAALQRSMGLKMEQLKAEIHQLDD